jgi:hypothetical protein
MTFETQQRDRDIKVELDYLDNQGLLFKSIKIHEGIEIYRSWIEINEPKLMESIRKSKKSTALKSD